jgi:general secretion pathway protein A
MFLKHFQLEVEPFGVAPDPNFFYFGPDHSEALAALYYVFTQHRGCGLVLGEAGLGKTVTLQYLTAHIRSVADPIVLTGPMNGMELLQALTMGFGISGLGSATYHHRRALEQILLARTAWHRRTVLCIDNAELLSTDALQTLQDLCGLETTTGNLIDILMTGNRNLLPALQAPALEPLSQRIEVSCRISPLDVHRTAEYLAHRTHKAGAKRDLFTADAANLLAAAACGVPRRINALAHQSLVCAWAHNATNVCEAIVHEVLCSLRTSEVNHIGGCDPTPGALVPSHV